MSILHYTTVSTPSQKTSPSAVLMLLHGVGSNEQNMIHLAEGADDRLTIITVRAPLTMGPNAFAWFPVRFTDAGPVLEAAEAERSRLALLHFIEEYQAEHHIDQVYLMGFSQGAIMAAAAALTAPETIQGALCFSGRIPQELLPRIASPERLAATSLWVTHGVQDDKLPIHHGRATRDLLANLGAPYEYHEFPEGHTITGTMQSQAHNWLQRRLTESKA